MLQTSSAEQPAYYEDQGEGFDLSSILGIAKRRFAYFLVPFLVVLMLGTGIVAIQRPIFRAEGKILVESPEIPADLVRPTITELADERIQVIEQRLMARDNLLAIVSKYNLFPRERASMSGTDLLEMMRNRTDIKPIALDSTFSRQNTAIAFTLSFDYEVPELAAQVANDFLTSILSEDASTRTNNASETTKFLEREVKRLQTEHDAVVAQIEVQKERPPDQAQTDSETLKTQQKTLASLQADLTEKSTIYSAEHPAIKNLKKQIAAIKQDIATAPQTAPASATGNQQPADVATEVLTQQRLELERSLDDANRKLTTAKLGESMERGEKGERLRVIEQPSVPSKPVRPKKLKWFAASFALAAMVGAGCVLLAELLDGSIRGRKELFGVVDRSLIIALPYIATAGEQTRKRRKLVLLCAAMVIALAAAIAFAVIKGISIDFSGLDRSWVDALRQILH
jgi:uncharacterized protein involved in exopolysaccharide biosynthesis